MLSRRNLLSLSATALAVSPFSAFAAEPVEGKEFTHVRPEVPVNGEKIEVVSFFSYSCPHCLRFEPLLMKWAKTAPDWISFQMIPVAWDSRTLPLVKAYYTLQAMGLIPQLHSKFFESVVFQTHRYEDLDTDIADFMVKNGVDAAKWKATYDSFGVSSRSRTATQMWQSYGIDATPMVGIDGKFLTGPHMTGTRENCIKVISTLAERAQKARK